MDALVQLVALALPELDFSGLNPDAATDDQYLRALQELKSVVLSVRAGGEAVDITPLAHLMATICPGVDVGSHGDPFESWRTIVGTMEDYLDMTFCKMTQLTTSVCVSCENETSAEHPRMVAILHLSGLANGGKYTVGDLLGEEFHTTEILEDCVCNNPGCVAARRRQEIKRKLKDLGKGGQREEKKALVDELYGLKGTRKSMLIDSPPYVLVDLNRDRKGSGKSTRHVKLQVGQCQTINGGQYSLVGIARHHGVSKNSGHWTTLARDDEGQWFKYERSSKVKVAEEDVSSNEAVHIVYRKEMEENVQ